MKTLIIAEKPSVARDIAAALGAGFTTESASAGASYLERDDLIIASALGHLVELQCPADQDPGYQLARLPAIPSQFALAAKPQTVGKLKLLDRLIKRNDVEAVVNACDAGREGELIFRYIVLHLDCQKPMYRMWLQSMTSAAIMSAYAEMEPAHVRDNLFLAAQSRTEADWLIGINGSRVVSILYEMTTGRRAKNTVGRVQTPTLYILVERELARQNFVAKDFYEVHATFAAPGNPAQTYRSKWTNPAFQPDPRTPDAKPDRFLDRQSSDAIAARCRGHQPTSVTDTSKEIATLPPTFFDLTTLQREANKKFGFTASNTLKLAQSLYEKHKALTYPRTDATALPEDYIETATKTLTRIIEAGHPLAGMAEIAIPLVRPDKRLFNNAKISDHFAIIPTGRMSPDLTPDEKTLYDLVVSRFIAAFHPSAVHLQTMRTTFVNNEAFRTMGRIQITAGWLSVYSQTPDDESAAGDDANNEASTNTPLCALAPGQTLPMSALAVSAGKTRKPPQFTEASLLGAMETAGNVIENDDLREAMKAHGLGTPSTRAPTIEHLIAPDVGYVIRQKKFLVPTPKAIDLIGFLTANGLQFLTEAKTTGEWEYALLQMEQGRYMRDTFMTGIHQMTHALVTRVKHIVASLPPEQQALQAPPTDFDTPCPRCQGTLSATSSNLTCACGFKLWKTLLGLRLTDDQCTTLLTTGAHPKIEGFLSVKTNKSFAAGLRLATDLSGKVELVFEERAQAQGGAETAAKPTEGGGHLCPDCGKPMRLRTSGNKRPFWGCSGYPKCKKAVPDDNGRPKL